MAQKNEIINNTGKLFLIAGFIILVAVIFIFRRPPFYDEDDYLLNVAIIHQYGFGKAYLLHLIGSAGPLYSIIHFFLEPLTGLQAPQVRLVNILFLAGLTVLNSRSLYQLGYTSPAYALAIMAIPMTYVISGLALTEMPAMFFLAAGIYLAIRSADPGTHYPKALLLAIAAGLCTSLAILGRQPYLLTLAAFPLLFYNKEYWRKNGLIVILFLFFSLVLPCYVFFVWKGLVAPGDAAFYAQIARRGIAFRPELFFLCVAYYGMVFYFISPGFYIQPSRKESLAWLMGCLAVALVNHIFNLVRYLPLKAFLGRLFAFSDWLGTAEKLSGAALVMAAVYFLFMLARHVQQSAYRKELLFYAVASLAVAVSCIKLTHGFSSRYAAQAIPLLIPLAAFFSRKSFSTNLRLAAGIIIGFISLFSYLLH